MGGSLSPVLGTLHLIGTRRIVALATLLSAIAVTAGAPMPALATAPDPKAVQAELNATAAEYHKVEAQLAVTETRIDKLEQELAQADQLISLKAQGLRDRAAFLYKAGRMPILLDGLLTSPDLASFSKRIEFLGIIGENDSKLVDEMKMLKSRADVIREQLDEARDRQRRLLTSLRQRQRELETKLKSAIIGARVARFGDFGWFTLPIRGPVAFSNSWGDPRSGGRRHQGTDLMAPCGADVVAVTDGTIQDMRSGGAGGIMLYLRARNGDVFFYAHLRGYASGVHSGKRVTVGQLIAYNGNSGNARGGPCHVHFEWHPGGGRPVNPYPLLRAALG